MVHGPQHAFVISCLQRLGPRFSGLGCHLRCQLPLTLSEVLEPEPDAALVRGVPEDYLDRHPRAEDTIAAIEIADSSLSYDRTTKQRIYADAGIAVYWLVSIPERMIDVFSTPVVGEGGYQHRTSFLAGQTVPVQLVAGRCLEVAVDDILPRT